MPAPSVAVADDVYTPTFASPLNENDPLSNVPLPIVPAVPLTTSNAFAGDVVPSPNRLFVLSQKKFAFFCAMVVPSENKTEPLVSDGKVNLPAIALYVFVRAVSLRNFV